MKEKCGHALLSDTRSGSKPACGQRKESPLAKGMLCSSNETLRSGCVCTHEEGLTEEQQIGNESVWMRFEKKKTPPE